MRRSWGSACCCHGGAGVVERGRGPLPHRERASKRERNSRSRFHDRTHDVSRIEAGGAESMATMMSLLFAFAIAAAPDAQPQLPRHLTLGARTVAIADAFH